MSEAKTVPAFMPPKTAITPVEEMWPVGSEVQLKKAPSFGYTVIAAIRNERSLQALDGSCLGMALAHELEAFCDIEQAHFTSKAREIILKNMGTQDAATSAASQLWIAGARFPDAVVGQPVSISDEELARLVCDAARIIFKSQGFEFNGMRDTDENIAERWYSGHRRIRPMVELAIQVVDLARGSESRDALDGLVPSEARADFI